MTPRAQRIRNTVLMVAVPLLVILVTAAVSGIDDRYVHRETYLLKSQKDSLERIYETQQTRAALGRLDTTTKEILACLKSRGCRP